MLAGPPLNNGQPIIDPLTGLPYPGAVDNSLTGNVGYRNGSNAFFTSAKYDGADFNAACDNNDWSANVFVIFNDPCVVAP